MSNAKIQLSPAEMSLMCNAGILLTKNSILQKVRGMLEEIQEQMMQDTEFGAADTAYGFLFATVPKISRGENYLGLPYLILDYPRNFSGDNIFAVRTFFWWGHFFSSTLHISGRYKTEFTAKLSVAYPLLAQWGYYIGIAENAWQHHFKEDNYVPVNKLSVEDFTSLCYGQQHVKIAANWPLTSWEKAPLRLLASWKKLLAVCCA